MNKNVTAYIDLSLLLLMGFVCLFIIAFMHINPKAISNKDIETPDHYMLVMTWNDSNADDIDLWLLAPNGQKVYFQKKSQPVAYMDRDDLGASNDYAQVNGELKLLELNREVIYIKRPIDGEWFVSVHYYSEKDQKSHDHNIKLELIKVKPYTLVYKGDVPPLRKKQEHAAFSFTIKDEKVTDISTDQRFSIVDEAKEQ